MSRFYLILAFLLLAGGSFAQNELGKYLEFADEKSKQGDYVYALEYYEKAMQYDSSTVSILWRYAETLKAYKDYRRAEIYYQQVYEKEEANIYPASLLEWALMTKQNGKYDEAIELFKRAKKKYAKKKKEYLYLKSKQELESCLWAKSVLKDTSDLVAVNLPAGLNTVNSEFGHTIIDKEFILSSLRADSIDSREEVYSPEYKHGIYSFDLNDSLRHNATKIEVLDQVNSGNGSLSPDGKRFYFSQCESRDYNYHCQVAVSRFRDGKWNTPELLGDIINEPGANTTMPHVSIFEGEETLFFASDKPGGEGGLDIYFSEISDNGNKFGKVRELKKANSPDNELSPWYSGREQRIYFSSSWWNGFGGQDVHYLPIYNGSLAAPVNAGQPINSPANDQYFFKAGDTAYVSSNRIGVLYAKNPTCCSDIFAFTEPVRIAPVTKKETLADLNKRLPVTLYFHNDVPGPRTYEPSTTVSYLDSYNDYLRMIPEYKKEYAKGLNGERAADAEEDIENFFTQYVEQGAKDLRLFLDLLAEELEKGIRIRLNVQGFASPLAKTDYNVSLTRRRIMSLENELKRIDNGFFAPFLGGTATNGGKLEIVGVPFGEYTAEKLTSDNPNDQKNSVFSRAAAIERKIQIQSVSYLDSNALFLMLDAYPTTFDFSRLQPTDQRTKTVTLYNSSNQPLVISKIEYDTTAFKLAAPREIAAGKNAGFSVSNLVSAQKGFFSSIVLIYFEGFEKPFRLDIVGERL